MAMGGGVSPNTSQLYVQTPLLRSKRLSDLVEANVWMKMETVQTSGSFKTRGLSNFAKKAVSRGCTKFVSSSGKPHHACCSKHSALDLYTGGPLHFLRGPLSACSLFLFSSVTTFYPSLSPLGGNAGLAAAYIARELGLPITVVIPTTTPPFIADKLREEGANVEVVGQVRATLSHATTQNIPECYVLLSGACRVSSCIPLV